MITLTDVSERMSSSSLGGGERWGRYSVSTAGVFFFFSKKEGTREGPR